MAEATNIRYPRLTGGRYCDTVVVGAGLAGLTAAWNLRQAGMDVVLLEKHRVGSGLTGQSTGILALGGSLPFAQWIRRLGPDAAWDALAWQRQALLAIQENCRRHGWQNLFRPLAVYRYVEKVSERRLLAREVAAARSLSLAPVRLDRTLLPLPMAGAVKLCDQAWLAAGMYAAALAHAFVAAGGRLFEATAVERLEEKKHSVAAFTTDGLVKARHAVVAANAPFYGRPRHRPVQSLVANGRLASRLPEALHWNLRPPLYWIRTGSQKQGGVLVARTPPSAREPAKLEGYLRRWLGVDQLEIKRSPVCFETPDQLPEIGRVSGCREVYQAAGLGSQGLLLAAGAGQLLADLVLRKPHRAADLFAWPRRIRRPWWTIT